ncbi:MAG: DUF2784 domain-containing protein [Verrucomicrobiota bacterium]
MSAEICRALADGVLITHVAFVAFVVIGLLLILCGGFRGWKWIRNPWFRAAHLSAIGVVVIQAWFGIVCPLTTLEMHLRDMAGDPTYNGTFVAHWLRRLLFFDAPLWAFAVCYTLFGLAVIGSWVKFRPRPFRQSHFPSISSRPPLNRP